MISSRRFVSKILAIVRNLLLRWRPPECSAVKLLEELEEATESKGGRDRVLHIPTIGFSEIHKHLEPLTSQYDLVTVTKWLESDTGLKKQLTKSLGPAGTIDLIRSRLGCDAEVAKKFLLRAIFAPGHYYEYFCWFITMDEEAPTLDSKALDEFVLKNLDRHFYRKHVLRDVRTSRQKFRGFLPIMAVSSGTVVATIAAWRLEDFWPKLIGPFLVFGIVFSLVLLFGIMLSFLIPDDWSEATPIGESQKNLETVLQFATNFLNKLQNFDGSDVDMDSDR